MKEEVRPWGGLNGPKVNLKARAGAQMLWPPTMPRRASKRPEFDPDRRVLVRHLTFLGGGVVLLGCKREPPKPTTAAPLKKRPPPTTSHLTFTQDEWVILEAAVARIVPKDDTPGALEAGVPTYIDRVLQTPQLERMRRDFPPGLLALDRRAQRLHQKPFIECTPAQQDAVLTFFKDSPETSGEARWYEYLLVLTLEGFLGDPSYGGNQGKVGWALVGFELVGAGPADPTRQYDGKAHLHDARCGGGKGC